MEDVSTRVLEQHASLLIFIAKLNQKVKDFLIEEWGDLDDDPHFEPAMTFGEYEEAVKAAFEEMTKEYLNTDGDAK